MRKSILTLFVFVLSAFVVFAQVPQNVETASRYRSNVKKTTYKTVANNSIMSIDIVQKNINEKKSNAQLEDLGTRYGWSRSNAQLEDLGTRYGWSRSNAQLEDLGTRYGWSRSNAQLEDLGTRYGWSRSNAQLEDLGTRYGWTR